MCLKLRIRSTSTRVAVECLVFVIYPLIRSHLFAWVGCSRWSWNYRNRQSTAKNTFSFHFSLFSPLSINDDQQRLSPRPLYASVPERHTLVQPGTHTLPFKEVEICQFYDKDSEHVHTRVSSMWNVKCFFFFFSFQHYHRASIWHTLDRMNAFV